VTSPIFSPNPADWQTTLTHLQTKITACSNGLASAQKLSKQIVVRYDRISPLLESLCRHTCPTCVDNCCRRATVWYDRRDLLTIYLATGSFPSGPVITRPHQPCNKLGEAGCTLQRSARPFVCSWYLCPPQKQILQLNETGVQPSPATIIAAELFAIKEARKTIDSSFLGALAAVEKAGCRTIRQPATVEPSAGRPSGAIKKPE
jgi:hypothetical protein